MASYKLYYWNAKGGAESIRIIFAQAGVKYEDVRFEGEDWVKQYKPGMAIVCRVCKLSCIHDLFACNTLAGGSSYSA